MARSAKVLIVGGGIGGLTTALALLRRGIDVDVYEQAAVAEEVGAGLSLSSNGNRVLIALGLAAALAKVQVTPPRREIRHWRTGEAWDWFELGAATTARFGAPHTTIHRGDLHAVLIDAVRALKPDAVHLSQRCVGAAQDDAEARLQLADGATVTGNYVIGADGLRSVVRAGLFGAEPPDFSGCIAWRALVPMDRLPASVRNPVTTNWLGPGGHVLHYPVRRGEIMNIVCFIERPDWPHDGPAQLGTRDELRADFRDWHADVHAILQETEAPLRWALFVRGAMTSWHRGRIGLLGDACHPTLPFLGQGGVMAIEDSYVLAACLERYFTEPSRVFERYEALRRERTASVVAKSHENRRQAFNPSLADAGALSRSVTTDWQQTRVKERLDWLYAYDATALPI